MLCTPDLYTSVLFFQPKKKRNAFVWRTQANAGGKCEKGDGVAAKTENARKMENACFVHVNGTEHAAHVYVTYTGMQLKQRSNDKKNSQEQAKKETNTIHVRAKQ